MYAKFSKCEFWLTKVRFLGHVVSASGVSIDPEKVDAVMSWERLKSVFETQFLRIGRVLLEVHSGLLPISYTYDEIDRKEVKLSGMTRVRRYFRN